MIPFEGTHPHVQAIATHEGAFDDRHLGADAGGPGGSYQSRGSGADDNEVVSVSRLGVDVVGRMDVGLQLLIVFVQWLELFEVVHDQTRARLNRYSELHKTGEYIQSLEWPSDMN